MSLDFTLRELKIRRQWLGLSFFYYIVYPLVIFGWLMLSFRQGGLQPAVYEEVGTDYVIEVLGGFLAVYLLYYCTYLKRGNRLLTFCLVIEPVSWINEIKLAFTQASVFGVCVLLNILLYGWWSYLSFKVKKMNDSKSFENIDVSI